MYVTSFLTCCSSTQVTTQSSDSGIRSNKNINSQTLVIFRLQQVKLNRTHVAGQSTRLTSIISRVYIWTRTLISMENIFSNFKLGISLTFSPRLCLSTSSNSLFHFHSHSDSLFYSSLIGRPDPSTNQWHALIIERLTSIGWLEQPKTHEHTACTYTHPNICTPCSHTHNLTTYCTLTCSPWGQFIQSKYIQDCLRKLEYCDKVLYFL